MVEQDHVLVEKTSAVPMGDIAHSSAYGPEPDRRLP